MKKEEAENIFQEMEAVIDSLINVATKLKEISFQVISSEQVEQLQKEQQVLLKKLAVIEKALPKDVSGDEKAKKRIQKKLDFFQSLNKEFIANLNKTHSVINFRKES